MPPAHPPSTDSDDDDADSSPTDSVTALLAKCTELKTGGNDLFKAGELGAATTTYQEAVDKLTSNAAKKALGEFFKANPDAQDTASPLLASLHTNLAACHVKLSQWESAVQAATAALKVEASNVKARFRRGVAHSNLGNYDEAKSDLTAVAKADPKNREARTILEVVNAALKERTQADKERAKKAFAGGTGLYADEEAKAAKAAKAAAEAKAAQEAALLKEWRAECDKLRMLEGEPNATIDMLSAAAKRGDAEAQANLDRLAPISLKQFGEDKLRKAKEAKEKADAEETKRRAKVEAEAAERRRARSDVTRLEAEDEDEAELLKGLSKGYKTRADGSKTSYFDRSEHVDPKTKALLEAQKAPKKIDISDPSGDSARASGGGGGGVGGSSSTVPSTTGPSVWNTGTYEERDVSAWATAELKSRLGAIATSDVGGGGGGACEVRVSEVKDVEGHASIISNRGKLKRPFEFKLELAWELHDGDPAHSCEGNISLSEISPAPTGHAKAVTYESSERFSKAPQGAQALEKAKAARSALQRELDAAMAAFVEALARK